MNSKQTQVAGRGWRESVLLAFLPAPYVADTLLPDPHDWVGWFGAGELGLATGRLV